MSAGINGGRGRELNDGPQGHAPRAAPVAHDAVLLRTLARAVACSLTSRMLRDAVKPRRSRLLGKGDTFHNNYRI